MLQYIKERRVRRLNMRIKVSKEGMYKNRKLFCHGNYKGEFLGRGIR